MTWALQLELLTGRYIATSYNDRARAEWPPHPARMFSALVDTWASGEPGSGEGEEERMALIWLERQAPPAIAASATNEVGHRSEAQVFVPVNDVAVVRVPDGAREKLVEAEAASAAGDAKATKSLEKLRKKLADDTAKALAAPAKISASDLEAAEELLPDRRGKQARMFPSVTPADPRVAFCWNETPEPRIQRALVRLADRLTRLGHSSSLVAARWTEQVAAPRYVPDEDGELTLRGIGAGQMDRLITAHHRHQGVESRVLPCRFVRYREGGSGARGELAHSLFSEEWIVFAWRAGARLPSTSAVGVSQLMRRALSAANQTPLPESLSGHRQDRSASERPHLAVVPLIDVAHRHAHGGILGVALVPPRDLAEEDRAALLRAIALLEQSGRARLRDESRDARDARDARDEDDVPAVVLELGRGERLVLERVVWGEHRRVALQPGTWNRASRRWATATPIALDRNPGDLHHADPAKRARAFDEATAMVAEAVARLGLPAPTGIDVLRSCVLAGTEKPNRFPRYPIAKDRPQRVLVHARLQFAEPVRGPLLLGNGRYQGLGLCRPVEEKLDGAAL